MAFIPLAGIGQIDLKEIIEMHPYTQEHYRKILFQRFCRIFGIRLGNELTSEGMRKAHAALDAIDDEKEEEDRRVLETIADARSSVYP